MKMMTDVEELNICPQCGKTMTTDIPETVGAEEDKLLRSMGVDDDFIRSHRDVYRTCGCGYSRHETWMKGEMISASEGVRKPKDQF